MECMKKNLIIIGSGPLALQISHYASLSGKYCVVGFLNDFEAKGTKVGEYEILGNLSDVDILYEKNIFDECFVAIGYNHFDVKDRLYHELKEKDLGVEWGIKAEVNEVLDDKITGKTLDLVKKLWIEETQEMKKIKEQLWIENVNEQLISDYKELAIKTEKNKK